MKSNEHRCNIFYSFILWTHFLSALQLVVGSLCLCSALHQVDRDHLLIFLLPSSWKAHSLQLALCYSFQKESCTQVKITEGQAPLIINISCHSWVGKSFRRQTWIDPGSQTEIQVCWIFLNPVILKSSFSALEKEVFQEAFHHHPLCILR